MNLMNFHVFLSYTNNMLTHSLFVRVGSTLEVAGVRICLLDLIISLCRIISSVVKNCSVLPCINHFRLVFLPSGKGKVCIS